MKNKIRDLTFLIIIILSYLYIINYGLYIKNSISTSINLWISNVIPILFPTFIISDFIISSSIPFYIYKTFKIDFIYIISIITGSPTNAFLLNNSRDDITKRLACTKYVSFIFLYTSLIRIFDFYIALYLIFVNIFCNFFLFLLIKNNFEYIKTNNNSFNIIDSIKKSFAVCLNILGFIIFFNLLPIGLINNNILKSFLYSLLEITSSFSNLSTIILPFNYKLLFSIITINTCGICIECQIKSIISDTLINYNKYLLYRLLHLMFYLILCIPLLFFY